MGRGDAGDGVTGAGVTGVAPESPLFSFTVPEELLREAIAHSRDREAVADLQLVPGAGEGKPPPFRSVLRVGGGPLPLFFLTLAAFVPGMIQNGLGVLAPDIQRSFHINGVGIGALFFVMAVAQIAWGLPVALFADRRSRKMASALSLLVFSVVTPLMFFIHNIWPFAFVSMVTAIGLNTSDTAHNSYLADAYPVEGRARVFAWHGLNDPIAQTAGILLVGLVASGHHGEDWRNALLLAAVGIPVALLIMLLREPPKGANESSHILKASGMDFESEQGRAPRVLLGSAITRLLRIRSLNYELIAVGILGFAGTGAPLFGSIYFSHVWHQDTAQRSHIYAIIGLAAFLGLPVSWLVGDRLFRRAPQLPLVLAGISITAYGGLFTASLYMPKLWMVVLLQFLANASVAPLSISIFQTLAATAPPEMRTICFGLFGVYALVFGGFAGGVVLGAINDAAGVRTALSTIGPVCAVGGILLAVGSRHVRRDITLVIEDVLERFAEGKRRREGGTIPALQVHNLDFYYGTQQVLFDVNVEVVEGEVLALLGTNGAGKSTLLRAVAGLDHPHRGVVRIFGANCTYLEPEQIITQGAALLVGGKMTLPGLSVRDNLRVGMHSFRADGNRANRSLEAALSLFPELEPRLGQAAGTLSGGEQQMLALARVMMSDPKLLMIDELALGLAPMTVDRLMRMVRTTNAAGTTVILVEQSINRAMSLAQRCVFLERGAVQFDGPTAELLERHDLLRPVFLASVDLAVPVLDAAAGPGPQSGVPAP